MGVSLRLAISLDSVVVVAWGLQVYPTVVVDVARALYSTAV